MRLSASIQTGPAVVNLPATWPGCPGTVMNLNHCSLKWVLYSTNKAGQAVMAQDEEQAAPAHHGAQEPSEPDLRHDSQPPAAGPPKGTQ